MQRSASKEPVLSQDGERPPAGAGPAATVLALVVFGLAAVAWTWPLAVAGQAAVSLRPDYFQFLWNAWWFGEALSQGVSPFWTDWIHHPGGMSLALDTLSPVNAVGGALLANLLDLRDAQRVVLLLHFALSGWTFFLMARELSGCTGGALLGGLVWSFSPYHFHFVAQLNLATLELLPLAVLFMSRVWQDGRVRDGVALAVVAGLIALSCNYYLVYAAFLGTAMLVGGRLRDPVTPFRIGASRLAIAGLGAGVSALLVSWPLVSALLGGELGGDPERDADPTWSARFSNDLLGYRWQIGAPESVTVSWPTMLGYVSLGVVAAGWRGLRGQGFWIVVAVLFLVLSWGRTAQMGGEALNVALPYAAVVELPIIGNLLRKPDRLFVLTLLAFSILVVHCWRDLSQRLPSDGARRWSTAGVAVCLWLELSAAPLETFEVPGADAMDWVEELGPGAVVSLPHYGGTGLSMLGNYEQTVHERKITQGYVTDHALTPEHRRMATKWRQVERDVTARGGGAVATRMANLEIDNLVLRKWSWSIRPPVRDAGRVYWAPFAFVRRELMDPRQKAAFWRTPTPPAAVSAQRRALVGALGQPVYEDDSLIVFRRE